MSMGRKKLRIGRNRWKWGESRWEKGRQQIISIICCLPILICFFSVLISVLPILICCLPILICVPPHSHPLFLRSHSLPLVTPHATQLRSEYCRRNFSQSSLINLPAWTWRLARFSVKSSFHGDGPGSRRSLHDWPVAVNSDHSPCPHQSIGWVYLAARTQDRSAIVGSHESQSKMGMRCCSRHRTTSGVAVVAKKSKERERGGKGKGEKGDWK